MNFVYFNKKLAHSIIDRLFIVPVLLVFVCTMVVNAQPGLGIGKELPAADIKMEEVNGRSLSLSEIAGNNGLLVIFTCNTCPMVIRYQDLFNELSVFARQNGIGVTGINSNEDYRTRGDGLEDMRRHAQKAGYNFPYLLDKNHQVADAFGASRTPQVYLFNGNRELVYQGAVNGNVSAASGVNKAFLFTAMEQMLAGEPISVPQTKAQGCTIKRVG